MKIPDKTIEDYVTEYIIEHGHQPYNLVVSNEAYAYGILTNVINESTAGTLHGHIIIRASLNGINVYTEATMKIREESLEKERIDSEVASKSIKNIQDEDSKKYTPFALFKSFFGFK